MMVPGSEFGNLSLLLNPMFDAAKTFTTKLQPIGMTLLSLAFVIELMNTFIQFWVKGGAQELISKMARLLIVTSIPFAALSSWPALPNMLVDFFQSQVSGAFTGVTGDGTAQISSSITNLFASAWGAVTPPTGATADAAGAAAEAAKDSHWYQLPDLTQKIMQVLVFMMLELPLLFFVIAMMFALYGPMLMLYLGIIFGPILIAWLPFEPLSNLATKWLNYMVTMGVAFAMGIVMAAIMQQSLDQFATMLASTQGVGDATLATLSSLIPLIAVLLFIGFMMLKVEHIAAGLVGGPSVGGGAGFFSFAAGAAMRSAGKGGGGQKVGGSSAGGPQGAGSSGGNPQGGSPTGGGSTGATGGSVGSTGSSGGGQSGASLSSGAGKASASPAPVGSSSSNLSSRASQASGGSAPSGGTSSNTGGGSTAPGGASSNTGGGAAAPVGASSEGGGSSSSSTDDGFAWVSDSASGGGGGAQPGSAAAVGSSSEGNSGTAQTASQQGGGAPAQGSGTPPSQGGGKPDQASAKPSQGGGGRASAMAQRMGKVANSGPGKVAAVSAAMAVNPVAGLAVGAYAASPALRSGVASAGRGVASAGRQIKSTLTPKAKKPK